MTSVSSLFNASFSFFDKMEVYGLRNDAWMHYAATVIAIVLLLAIPAAKVFQSSPFPLINGRKPFELSTIRPKKEFLFGGKQILLKGLKQAAGKPFRVIAEIGEVTVLPPKYAYEIRNREDLSSAKATAKVFQYA
jgi:hypothetical protein